MVWIINYFMFKKKILFECFPTVRFDRTQNKKYRKLIVLKSVTNKCPDVMIVICESKQNELKSLFIKIKSADWNENT
jgi:hypothetical protein